MKLMKKMSALLLAGALVVASVVPAMATENPAPTTYNITVNTDNDAATHTYKVYQIFTGTPEGEKLVDVQYGSSYPGGLTGPVPEATLSAITDARAWAAANKDSLGAEVATLNAEKTSYAAVPGWYLVLDTDYSGDDPDAYSAFMMEVVNDATTFTPKKEIPSVDKEVSDDEGESITWGESADHEIGETFQFRLTATIPADANFAAYETYAVTFNDTMSAGVTFEKINSVKVNENALEATGYTSTATAGQAGGSWTLTIDDVKPLVTDFTAGVTIVVEYDAHLNTAAIVHNTSATATDTNKNTVSLTYSNNPDATGAGETDTTPTDTVWVFTYNSDNLKTDANEKPVAGAGFELYAGKTEGTDKPSGTPISLYKVGTTYYAYDANKASEYTGGEVVTEMLTVADGKFEVRGLDVGTYTLYEKTVPTGYVQATNTIIDIEATHAENTNKTSADLTLTKDTTLNKTIVNFTGSTLPSTGGIGTTIFYVIGGILVVLAAVVLVSKRKAAK